VLPLYLVWGLVKRYSWGSRGRPSHWSGPIGLVSGSQSKSVPVIRVGSSGCIASGAAWSVVSLQGQPVGSFGLWHPPPPVVGAWRVAGVVGSQVLPPI
jgi:hypothetical protein